MNNVKEHRGWVEYFDENDVYHVEGNPQEMGERLNFETKKRDDGKTRERIYTENAAQMCGMSVAEWRAHAPLTRTGKLYERHNLPWLKVDLETEAKEKGADVTSLVYYNDLLEAGYLAPETE